MIILITMCPGIPCGVAVDLDEAIKSIIVQDTEGCTGVEVTAVTSPTCETLTNLVSCGKHVSFKDAFLASGVKDSCGQYSLKIFDLTEGR